VNEAGDPWLKAKRGRRPVHSARKMVVICILTATLGISYRNMQALLYLLRLPWQEPVPDHSTIHEAFKRIPENYLNRILAGSAGLCIAESGWVKGIIAADSTGIETDRYETVEVKLKKSRRKISIKYHVTAVLDYNIIMVAKITSRRTADSPTLRQMLKNLPQMEGSIFNADKAYDSDRNCELIYAKGMKPNIKQRETEGTNRGLRHRRRAAEEFNEVVYRYRGLVEGIFGAEEVENGLKTRCRLRKMQRRWGLAIAIGHNLAVYNRLRCARQLNIELKSILLNAEP
jgi:IS5 family transposase